MLLFIELFACLFLVLPIKVLSNDGFLTKFGEPILDYISKNSNPQKQITEYKAFFNKMKHNDFYSTYGVILGYLVTELRKLYPDKPDLEHIIHKFPAEILNIPWRTPVYIYNNATKQFLCAADEPLYDNSSYYKIYSSRKRNENCIWNFSVETNGQYFTIQNNANQRYIVAKPNPMDENEPRPIVSTVDHTTNIKDTSDSWQFQPYRNGKNKPIEFHIKNYLWDEYTCAYDILDVLPKNFRYFDKDLCLWRLLNEPKPLALERKKLLSYLYANYKGDSETAEILLKQANNSTTRIAEYINLFKLMKKHNGFYSVAGMILDYNVEQLLKQYPNYIDLMEIEYYFRNLWMPFPWNRTVTIQNKDDQKFVCVPDMEMGKPYMHNNNASCFWIFEIDSSGFYFKLKTFSPNRYLEAASSSIFFWKERAVLVSSKTPKEETDRWQLVHERTIYHEVVIKNLFFMETFYVYSNFASFRPATTRTPKNSYIWIIRKVKL